MIVFVPLLSWPMLAALGAVSLAVMGAAFRRAARGTTWRALGFCLLLAILSGPQFVDQISRPLPDVEMAIVDRSQSMAIGQRTAIADSALASLQAQAAKIPGLELRVVDVPPAASGGTALFIALGQSLAAVPAAQLAGVVAITDGEITDAPAQSGFTAPFTALLTAKGEETDRELRLLSAPAYGLAGKTATLQFEVLDHGVDDAGIEAPVTITEDGAAIWHGVVTIGQPASAAIPVTHAGAAVIAASVTPLPGEISAINDAASFTLNGVARRLEVLLISGNPNQSERSWRLLLKSDPAVELVHFTILRLPNEMLDATPDELALVPFPVAQLFDTDLDKFDLIILDEFNTVGLLPPQYLSNIATHVQNGGALLVEVGPEFATGNSLALTPLSTVLPAVPAPPGTITQIFTPAVTALGDRHPVAAPFANQPLAPWYRMEAAGIVTGDVLMTGAGGWPLLVLGQESQGRVGMLLSDQFWLWTRGGAHTGPALPLLRRVVHWLLREPALEAEALSAQPGNGQLHVQRQTLSTVYPGDATIISPGGSVQTSALRKQSAGVYAADVVAAQPGVWKISEGGMTAYAAQPMPNAEEYEDLAASAGLFRGLGNIVWLGKNPNPDLASLLQRQHAKQVTGTKDVPLLPPLPAMILATALMAAAWWRER